MISDAWKGYIHKQCFHSISHFYFHCAYSEYIFSFQIIVLFKTLNSVERMNSREINVRNMVAV